MFALSSLGLVAVVAGVLGVGLVVARRVVRRRLDAWADAVLFSFGLPPERDRAADSVEHLPIDESASQRSNTGSWQPTRRVAQAESDDQRLVEVTLSE
jgi:hypothetical protein